MVATLEAVWNRGHVVFGAACYMHGLLTSPDWQTLEVFIFPLSHLQCDILYIMSMILQWTLSTKVLETNFEEKLARGKYQVEGVTAESVLLSWLEGERVISIFF